jgi:hypothetical protein
MARRRACFMVSTPYRSRVSTLPYGSYLCGQLAAVGSAKIKVETVAKKN